MNPKLVLDRYKSFPNDGTIKQPQNLEKIQEACQHDIAFEKEGLFEIVEYECMLCKKKFEGIASKDKLPSTTYVVPFRLASNMNQMYEEIIRRFAVRYSKNKSIDIVRIIKCLEPTLLDLDKALRESDYLRELSIDRSNESLQEDSTIIKVKRRG